MGVKTERKRVDSLCDDNDEDDDEQKRAHFKAISGPPPSLPFPTPQTAKNNNNKNITTMAAFNF